MIAMCNKFDSLRPPHYMLIYIFSLYQRSRETKGKGWFYLSLSFLLKSNSQEKLVMKNLLDLSTSRVGD